MTTINKQWLPRLAMNNPLCHFSEPLETPSPSYDQQKDSMICYVIPRYGPHLWELPAYMMKYPSKDESVYKWFAKQFLEGKIIAIFGVLQSYYSSSPNMLTKPQIPLKAMTLINSLKKEQCMSKKQLLQCWKKNGNYLKSELSSWFMPKYQKVLDLIWPYVIKGADVPSNIMKQLKQ